MSRVSRLALPAAVAAVLLGAAPLAQQPNPYETVQGWAKMPAGRTWGATSAVFPARDGKHMWVGERCGQNSCADKPDLDPVLLFDPAGNLVRSFGKGLIVWPHGIFVDGDGNVWITDARGDGNRGHQVLKFSPQGEVLMRLGTAGVAGTGPGEFNQPADVLVAPDGSIFVADGHGSEGSNRIVKLAKDGAFIKAWGQTGSKTGEFSDPHALAMDSAGRLFVADRNNNRIQVFDQEGNFAFEWRQFGRPSDIFIAADDTMYVADSESNNKVNPGWKRGIWIGSAKDGKVHAFIPDPETDQDNVVTSGPEGVAADAAGNVYGAEVGPRQLLRHGRKSGTR